MCSRAEALVAQPVRVRRGAERGVDERREDPQPPPGRRAGAGVAADDLGGEGIGRGLGQQRAEGLHQDVGAVSSMDVQHVGTSSRSSSPYVAGARAGLTRASHTRVARPEEV